MQEFWTRDTARKIFRKNVVHRKTNMPASSRVERSEGFLNWCANDRFGMSDFLISRCVCQLPNKQNILVHEFSRFYTVVYRTWYRQDIKSRFPTGYVARRTPGIIELRWLYIMRSSVIIRNVETELLISCCTLRWHDRPSRINWNRLEFAWLELQVLK